MSKCEICAKHNECPREDERVYTCQFFVSDREQTYAEKTAHKERSLHHQPNHNKHWKKTDA